MNEQSANDRELIDLIRELVQRAACRVFLDDIGAAPGSWERRIAAALLQNAADDYRKEPEDIDAWLDGAPSKVAFEDICTILGLRDIRAVKAYIRGERRAEEFVAAAR